MSILSKLKDVGNKVKSYLSRPITADKVNKPLVNVAKDYYNWYKSNEPVSPKILGGVVGKLLSSKPEPLKAKIGGKEIAVSGNLDPANFMLATGATKQVGVQGARLLRKALEKGVGKETLNQITKIPEKIISPLTKIKDKFNILKSPSEKLVNFIKNEGQLLSSEAEKRTTALSNFTKTSPAEIVKIRRAGNGMIKITKPELEVMKTMGDLKPSVGDYYFQNPIRVFEQLGEPVKELFYRPVKAAEAATIRAKNFWKGQVKDVTKGLSSKSSGNIMKYALSLEKDGAEILSKNKLSAPLLNAKEKAAYDFMRSRYDTLLEQVNNARAIVGKDPIKKRANYITHIRDLGILDNMGFSAVTDDIETLITNQVHRNSPAFQFAKKRGDQTTKVELDALNVFNKYQEKALENIYMTPAIAKIRELSRTTIDDGLNKFNLQAVAPRMSKYVTEWTDYVAGQKIQTHLPKIVENTMKKLNQNNAFATLSFNVRSAFIQPAAIVNTVTEINPKNALVGIKELLRGKGKFALDNSNVLEGRQFETAIQDMANNMFGKTSRIKNTLGEVGIKPLQFLDSLTAQATWLGAYNKAVNALKLEGKKAFNYADDIVVKTQASATASDTAKIQRSTGGRMVTQFQTFVINDFNRLITDVAGIGNKTITNTERIKKASTYLVAISLWNYLSEDVLGVPTPFPRPLKALKEKKGALGVGKELAGQVPIIGGAARYGSSITGAVGDLVQSAVSKASGKYTPTSWWEIVGKLTGVPGTTQLKKTISSIKGLSDGYTVSYQKKLANGKVVTKKTKVKITDTVDTVRALLFGMYDTRAASTVRSTSKPLKKTK